MPNFQQHLDQAKHNRDLAKLLDNSFKDKYNDWVVTTCFYTSLHLIEAMIYHNDNLRVPSSTYPRYDAKTTVSKTGVQHSFQLEDDYGKSGHELRDRVIKDNLWFFKNVGLTCSFLRNMSQSARYDCQAMTLDDTAESFQKLYDAAKDFNSWALKKNLATF